ncbi:predicted protein [Nematostella vectensis]|uniref:Uncharacterized protein n=2 Tax=Nematostella vectensis TaxID=45351 RepID=A7SJC6_NEMVE|nr:predicted protein [Nematostella vectensis]|eukprot:XP_001628274.1 predicted protein [Nematostella vectensis]
MDQYLLGRVNESLQAQSLITCSQRCLQKDWCISINYDMSRVEGGKCELKDYEIESGENVKTQNPEFEPRAGWVYSRLRTTQFNRLLSNCTDCYNGATCKVNCTNLHLHHCICVSGYTGAKCEVDFDECASAPCAHNGTCTDIVNNFTCACTPGFGGRQCAVDVGVVFVFRNHSKDNFIDITARLPSLNAFTVCTWYQIANWEDENVIFSYISGDGKDALGLGFKSKDVYVAHNNKISPFVLAESLPTSSGWNHFCLEWDHNNGRFKFYDNGEKTGEQDVLSTNQKLFAANGTLRIGQGGTFSLSGNISGFAFYSNTLGKGKTKDVFEAGCINNVIAESDLALQWKTIRDYAVFNGFANVASPANC